MIKEKINELHQTIINDGENFEAILSLINEIMDMGDKKDYIPNSKILYREYNIFALKNATESFVLHNIRALEYLLRLKPANDVSSIFADTQDIIREFLKSLMYRENDYCTQKKSIISNRPFNIYARLAISAIESCVGYGECSHYGDCANGRNMVVKLADSYSDKLPKEWLKNLEKLLE